MGELAIVMTGGGARAAYQIGFLRYLGEAFPNLHVPIVTGVSAGALNAAYLASRPASFGEKTAELAHIWSSLTIDQVIRADPLWIAKNVSRWGARLLMGRASQTVKARSLFDPTPLQYMLEQVLQPTHGHFPGIQRNLKAGRLRAVALTASSYTTGQSVTWVQGTNVKSWQRIHGKSILCVLNIKHILASASLPLFFPAVRISGDWYGDGGIRLTAPLSPAVYLGASRILAISNNHLYANSPSVSGGGSYPTPAQIIGAMFDAIFLDVIDDDAVRLEHLNQLIAPLAAEQRLGLRHVGLKIFRPSIDLDRFAPEYEAALPRAFRFMLRGLGTADQRASTMLSLLMFQPDYLQRVIAVGYADAQAKHAELAEFLGEKAPAQRRQIRESGTSSTALEDCAGALDPCV